MKKLFPIFIFVLIIFYFFRLFFLHNLLPIPGDTIIGLYHPFRDLYAQEYPNGVPFKNYLITDPVRQQYPWRNLVITMEKRFTLPLWNPYSFSGYPLLANHQSGAFYPFNIIFFFLPFSLAWSILIFLAPLLSGIFLFFYLRNLQLDLRACLLGSVTFAFCGFSVAWMEWGTIGHTLLWLPLILLSTDKFLQPKNKKLLIWCLLCLFSLTSSFFAGHLQTFFYLYCITIVYFFVRWIQFGKNKNSLLLYVILNAIFFILTAIQWIPTFQFILLSARNIDQADWRKDGWFIPWRHLIQFLAPDFFGNPATLNYWGVWNYGEFIGYIGIVPLVMVCLALFFRRDKKTLFYGTLFFLSLLFSFPNMIARIPFILQIPFISSAQPTRLLAITDFSLVILASFGLDYFIKRKKGILYVLTFFSLVFCGLWFFVSLHGLASPFTIENLSIARHNLIFPTTIFCLITIFLVTIRFVKKPLFSQIIPIIIVFLLIIAVFDLTRFAEKFIPFTSSTYLFPSTNTLSFLQSHIGNFRIMSLDDRILPPNFSDIYHIQSIDGYDPLYLKSYGQFIAASERKKSDITPPLGFNRIITPHTYKSPFVDLLGVKYILSLDDIHDTNLQKVFQERETRVYENAKVLSRVFFVQHVYPTDSEQKEMEKLFDPSLNLWTDAVVEDTNIHPVTFSVGVAKIINYTENYITIDTDNNGKGFLLLSDTYYPSWHVRIDNTETKVYKTDFTLRGVIVPAGKHHIVFYDTIF